MLGRSLSSLVVFFLMIRRPPRSTLDRSSAASDVYKRQVVEYVDANEIIINYDRTEEDQLVSFEESRKTYTPVSYTHLRAHETVLDLVCRLLLEKKNTHVIHDVTSIL